MSLRAAVVGVGYLGELHARMYRELGEEGVELVGVVDVDPGRLAHVSELCGVPGYPDYRALFGRVDLVSVATPTVHHHRVAAAFLARGVPALVEKPITHRVDHAEELVELSRRHGALLQVGHVERFNPALQAALPLLHKPRFVECHRLGPFPGRGTDVHVVLDLMIHDLDLLLLILGSEVTSVDAIGAPVISGMVDIANARLHFASGAVANVTASRVSVERLRKMRFFQEGSYVSVDYLRRRVQCYRLLEEGADDPDQVMPRIAPVAVEVHDAEPLREEVRAFVRAVASGSPSAVSGEDAVRALRLAHAVHDAMA